MARAVPRVFGVIPSHQTAHVGARRRAQRERAACVAICSDRFALMFDHSSLTTLHRAQRATLRPCESIANQVVRIVRVLLYVIPEPAGDGDALRVEQIRPWISTTAEDIRDDDGGKRSKRQAVTRESARGILVIGHLSDVRKTVRRFNHLS